MAWIRRAGNGVVRLHARTLAGGDRERGDVPGWVMITLMTAVIVVLIWGIASASLQNLLTDAFDRVTNQSNK
jgi:hypothetical protein